jgi:enediyne biosynthesis protein E4
LQKIVRTGSSYLSQSELTLTFGLGSSPAIEKVQIVWPSGMTDEVVNVGADATLLLKEGLDGRQVDTSLPR